MHTDAAADAHAAPVSPPPAATPLTVVGIGASAGGLKALRHFMEAVPARGGAAYVVIMHLDPERESRIAGILQDRTSLPVAQVTRDTAVQADHVYVIPPGHDLEMRDGTLRVVPRGGHPHHAPVDLFFRTLGEEYGARAVGVVLSGSGSDGTAGVRHIREHGGTTAAQLPGEADYESMPAAAIATGQVELVLPAAEIPGELLRLRRMPSPLPPDAPPPDTDALLARIFAALRARTGHDFHRYKRSTVLRRLERRLRFTGAETLPAYLSLLQESDAEARALVGDLLISVSGFFRDPAAFEALAGVIPSLFEGKGPDDSVRVWVAGCATGEEAYSLAILLSEHAATLAAPPTVQIFATDIDEKGYARGRSGLYPASVAGDLTPDRLRRFFVPEAEGYRVGRSLREGVLFAIHDVLLDPPFSRLDMVSCRNLLIYLQPRAQAQVVDTFHYALRPGGVLFLGTVESAGEDGRFGPAAGRQRIYRRDAAPHRAPAGAAAPAARHLAASAAPAERDGAADGGPPQGFSYGSLHLRMLEAYAPPSVVVNERMEVVHLSPGAGRFLHPGGGTPSHNLMDLSRGALRTELRSALYEAFQDGGATVRRVVPAEEGGAPVRLHASPLAPGDGDGDGDGAGKFALVVFEEETAGTGEPPAPPAPEEGEHAPAVARLQAELRRVRHQLEAASAARDRVMDELQAASEEFRSVNEEQKAAAEELETSREEIQSINEELTTIDQEHRTTIEEQKRTNADLQNLIEATEIATLFLDRALRIRRFTPAASAIFNFVPTDPGRPLAHITHRLDYPSLMADAEGVLASLERVEREVSSDGGAWYIVRISPYRAPDGGIDGAVLTFFDITARREAETALREAKRTAESANLAKGAFLTTLSHEFRTPLTAILMDTDVLKLDGTLAAGHGRLVERIRASGWHLASMVDEILTFARLDEGHETVVPRRLDAREIAREAAGLVEGVAHARHLGFVLDLPDEAVELETDGDKVRQILVNLCGNAVKYTDEGEIRLRVAAEDGRVVFDVSDTGVGVAPEHQALIFDRFWQVDGTARASLGGLGIGLAAAREFSRLLGGDVEVESEAGRGSTFRVWLPRTNDDGSDT